MSDGMLFSSKQTWVVALSFVALVVIVAYNGSVQLDRDKIASYERELQANLTKINLMKLTEGQKAHEKIADMQIQQLMQHDNITKKLMNNILVGIQILSKVNQTTEDINATTTGTNETIEQMNATKNNSY